MTEKKESEETRKIIEENNKSNGGETLKVPLFNSKMKVLLETMKGKLPNLETEDKDG